MVSGARRNGISFLDGRNIVIDNCIIKDTGNGSQAYNDAGTKIYSSTGVEPKFGIDLEAVRYRNEDGTLNETALNEDITIKNSTFENNHDGDVLLYTCNDVVIENNNFDSWIGNIAAYNITIRHNNFKARVNNGKSYPRAIHITQRKDPFGDEMNFNYNIYGNKIAGYQNGISFSGEDFNVYNNEVLDCEAGMWIGNLVDTEIHDNTFTSSKTYSYGLRSRGGSSKNVSVYNETYNVNYRPIDFQGYNTNSTGYLKIYDCTFNSANSGNTIYLKNANYIEFSKITSNVKMELISSNNILKIN